MDPIVHRVKKKYESRLQGFRKLDIGSEEGTRKIETFKITGTPTFVMLDKEGKEVDRLVGDVEEAVMEKFIEGNIKRAAKRQ